MEGWRAWEAWRESRLTLRRGSDAPPSLPVPESDTSAMSGIPPSPAPPNTCAVLPQWGKNRPAFR